jgi:very-short-patch-repair endonuclease
MPVQAAVPPDLSYAPFRGSDAVAGGLLTPAQLRSRQWRRLFRNIYVSSDVPLDHRIRCLAADLFLDGRGAISGRSAALQYGVDVLIEPNPVEVTVPATLRLVPSTHLTVVRSPLPDRDVQQWAGVTVTSPIRTAFDIARRGPLIEAVVGVDAMLAARLVTREALALFASERGRWPGVRQLDKVLVVCDEGAESPMETRLRLVLIAGRLPWPVTQYRVTSPDGRFVARLDLAYPRHRLGIEYEGDHHRGRHAYQRDLRRVNALRACGWTVLRFGAADVYRRPQHVIATVRAALTTPMPG